MTINSKYIFVASMDVDPDKEALFNEVYDTEHIPNLLKVPGVHAATRIKAIFACSSVGNTALPSPALRECRRRGLARRLVAVRRRAILIIPEGQRLVCGQSVFRAIAAVTQYAFHSPQGGNATDADKPKERKYFAHDAPCPGALWQVPARCEERRVGALITAECQAAER
jgi:hypothetical protein